MQMVWVQRLLLVKAVVFVLRCFDYQNMPRTVDVSAWFRSHDVPIAFRHGQVNGG